MFELSRVTTKGPAAQRPERVEDPSRQIVGSWSVAALPPGTVKSPGQLAAAAPEWVPCRGPMPVAAALREHGSWSLGDTRDFDTEDWWFRCRFSVDQTTAGDRLRFQGLATVADAWLNGTPLLHSESMYLSHEVVASGLRAGDNELLIRFHALEPLLAVKREGPRWKTGLVTRQRLRWYRTTLLGRIPGWCPPVAPVGPWRAIEFLPGSSWTVTDCRLLAQAGTPGGSVTARLTLSAPAGATLKGATLTVGGIGAPLDLSRDGDGNPVLGGSLTLPEAERWWPHTHGAQPLYEAVLTLSTGPVPLQLPLGRVGFRTLAVDPGDDGRGFGLLINDTEVFCRGACWTPLDLARLGAPASEYRQALLAARDAGMNMVRVGGTMVYEEDAFYDACDELGILVWQDFMFANMDYPSGDAAFTASVAEEGRQFLQRMQGRPALAVLCGGSEVQQQAAMLGLPRTEWSSTLVTDTLERCAREMAPGAAWVPSSPSGGTLPFHVDQGVGHYYGVGAYRRPLEDARRARVRFASECLAFSNVPEPGMMSTPLQRAGHAPAAAAAKVGVPRDPGAEWDFEDVRDHYVAELFAVDPAELRATDLERYLALGRIASGEVMSRTIGEWRRPGSSCRGALVWFLRDFEPGAGWGVLDSTGRPKAAWWYLKRACRPVTLIASDEGLNGLALHALNETADPVTGSLRITVYREGRVPIARAEAAIAVPPRAGVTLSADALFDGFLDLTYAYRFGPPGHDTVVAVLTDPAGVVLGSAFHRPLGLSSSRTVDLGLTGTAAPTSAGYAVTVRADRVALAVAVRAAGYRPEDNYWDLEPDRPRTLMLVPETRDPPAFSGTLEALNGAATVPIVVQPA